MAEASDRILKILLQLRADTSGAEQTKDAIDKVKDAAEKSSTATESITPAASGAARVVAGALLGGFLAAGFAAFKIYQHIESTVEAERRVNEEVAKQNREIDRLVTGMLRVAESAESIGDQIKIGDKAAGDLNKLSERMAQFRIKEIDYFSSWSDYIEHFIRKALTESGGLGFTGVSPLTSGQQEAAAQLTAAQRATEIVVRDTNIALDIAAEKTRQWVAATQNLPKGIEFYEQEVAKAQAAVDRLTAASKASPTDANVLAARDDANQKLDDAQHKLDQLNQLQDRLTRSTERTAEAVQRANFEGLDPAHKVEALDTEVLGLQSKLLELGVAAESPNAAFAKAVELINQGTLATQADQQAVFGLVSAWAQVVGQIAAATAAQQRMAQEVANVQAEINTMHAAAYGGRDDYERAKWQQEYTRLEQQRAKQGLDTSAATINNLIYEKQLGQENIKTWSEQDRASGKVASNQKEITAQTREQNALLAQIRFNQQTIEQNTFLSANAKQNALLQSYTQEMEALNAAILKQREYIARTALDPAQLAQARAELQKMTQDATLLGLKMQTVKLPIQAELANWVNSFGSTSHQIAQTIQGTIGTSLQGVNNLLLSAGDKSVNWKQQLVGVEKQIASTFLTMLENMALQQAAQMLGITTTSTAQTTAGAAIAAAHAPAAAAVSISSYGVAALVGEVLAIAAIGAIMAALSGGLAEGGRVPGPESRSDNVIMGMATGETVISAPASTWADSYYGPNWHFDMNAMRVPVPRGFADGGRVGNFSSISNYNTSQSQSGGDTHVFVVMNEDELRKRLLASDAGRKIVIDHFRGRRLDLGIA